MKTDARVIDAIQRIAVTQEGRVFLEFLKMQYNMDKEALVLADIPDQVRRLQGVARRTKELLNLFETK